MELLGLVGLSYHGQKVSRERRLLGLLGLLGLLNLLSPAPPQLPHYTHIHIYTYTHTVAIQHTFTHTHIHIHKATKPSYRVIRAIRVIQRQSFHEKKNRTKHIHITTQHHLKKRKHMFYLGFKKLEPRTL